ncbi:MAG: DUF2079 domain-containing protein [Cyanobacteriota bacterium]|nr:DUF2079 domain-containing protein [Cyanobacteriota bacterium]
MLSTGAKLIRHIKQARRLFYERALKKINDFILLPPPTVALMMVVAGAIFFALSNLRHSLFHSTGFDLGIYDQVVYLISKGKSPISSFLGYHHMGNHAAWSVYPLGLLYKIYPDVRWLFLVQAISLALGAWPAWSLARLEGLKPRLAGAIAAAYLLYPTIFNVNLFDFHPEVMAVPAIFGAILAAKRQQVGWFSVAIAWILGCKAVLSLTILAMGFWLWKFEGRKLCGLIALSAGFFWFLIVTQGIIPAFSGQEVAGVGRYSYLGDSVIGIIVNMFLLPEAVLGKILSWDSFKYLLLVILPVIWGLVPGGKLPKIANFIPLIPAIPTLFLNILSDVSFQRSLDYQYSLPVVPFLLLTVILLLRQTDKISVLAELKLPKLKWQLSIPNYRSPKVIILWSVVVLLLLVNLSAFSAASRSLDTVRATKEAIATVKTKGGVLTDNKLAPHLSHRETVKLLNQTDPENLEEFDYVVLNLRHPWPDTVEQGIILAERLNNSYQWKISYQKDDVVVFERVGESVYSDY